MATQNEKNGASHLLVDDPTLPGQPGTGNRFSCFQPAAGATDIALTTVYDLHTARAFLQQAAITTGTTPITDAAPLNLRRLILVRNGLDPGRFFHSCRGFTGIIFGRRPIYSPDRNKINHAYSPRYLKINYSHLRHLPAAAEAWVWEIDVFGRIRRQTESADADLMGSVEDYRDVFVVLYADVAATYVDVRAFQARIGYAEANAEKADAEAE